MKKIVLPLCTSGIIIILDQWIKFLVSSRAALYDTKVLIPNVLEFYYLHNDGAAMGLFSGSRLPLILFTGLAILVCLGILVFGGCKRNLLRYALALIIGGGIGNLIDRIALGFVIDFVRFPVSWFSYSFNIADCAVCIGAALLVLDLLLDLKRTNQKE